MEELRHRLDELVAQLVAMGSQAEQLRADIVQLYAEVSGLSSQGHVTSAAVRSVEAAVADLSRRLSTRRPPAAVAPLLVPVEARRGDVVFVVDGDAAARELATESLDHAGFRVRTFAAAEDVFDRLRIEVPSVALIDLALPGMPAPTLAEYLRTNPRTYRVCRLAMTAFVPSPRESRPFHALIDKPLAVDVLPQAVRRSVQRWRSHDRR